MLVNSMGMSAIRLEGEMKNSYYKLVPGNHNSRVKNKYVLLKIKKIWKKVGE